MELEIGKVYNGFKLEKKDRIEEINSNSLLFNHDKSGARLYFLQNDDDNKVFSISFRTPPKDSTGVPHILEHSVLCGSRKFPVKEPFVELIKGSLNTFLNAFTFPDKTMYPVASKNDKDFLNLMDVYLDAVFYPNLYKQHEILMQEGWHYELDEKDSEITYKGVVYNEMKGAFSSPESIMFRKIQESLFPDTPYGVESGGDPDVIPELTQEQFENFHKKYYHPSNSYIYLYGKLDLIKILNFIDENYLKYFDKIDVNSEIPEQKPFKTCREINVDYPISSGEKEDGKTYFSLNFAVGKAVDAEIYMAFDILEYLLLETPSSPLKKALIEADLGKDVFGVFDGSVLQPSFSVVVKNSDLNKKEKFKEVVFETLKKLCKEGIDKKLIKSAINIKEFALREADYQGYPKGLVYDIKCMDSWLYGASPDLHIRYENTLNIVKKALQSDYFEKLIETKLLNNTHSSIITVRPVRGLAEKRAKEIKEKLAEYKSSLSEAELNNLVDITKKLKNRQMQKDSQEDLNKIPLLSISDIDTKSAALPLEKGSEKGIKVLKHDVFTNKIAYINLYFGTENVPLEYVPYIGLLSALLGKISTKQYGYEDLSNEININTGGIRCYADVFLQNSSSSEFHPKLVIKSKALVDNTPKLLELLGEIIGHSKFDEYKRLKEVIQEVKSRLEMVFFESGHMVAAKRLSSYFSEPGKYEELLTGLSFYKTINDIEENLESKKTHVSEILSKISKLIFDRDNLLVSVTCEKDDYNKFSNNFDLLYQNIGENKPEPVEYNFERNSVSEGLTNSSKVVFVGKGGNFIKEGYSYSGSMQVLRTIINYDYLWNKVRVMGGAYGCFSRFSKNGNMFFVSYRDPNLKETIDAYNNAAEYLKNFEPSERDMTKYIIGTISDVDVPLTPSMQGERAAENYIKHITPEDVQKERDQILSTSKDIIRSYSKMVEQLMKNNFVCVVGSEEKINENKDTFSSIVNIFE